MNSNMKKLSLLLWAVTITLVGFAQEKKRLEIIHADEINMDPDISDAQRLLGNVKFKYNDALMFCDSAYRYPNGDFDAFSNVRVLQGDTLQLFSDLLKIDKDSKVAKLRQNIRLKDKQMTLTTDNLDYDFETELANYFGGGTIVTGENDNRLQSDQGFYDTKSKYFQFRNNVILKNPEYRVESDTLRYSSNGSRAYFHGPTNIYFKDSDIYCENGWYDSNDEICQFNENAIIRSGSTFMSGDSIFYNGASGKGEVFNNVEIRDTTSNYLILGQYGWHSEETGNSLVTDQAEMIQFFDSDSLFLHADTLKSYTDSLGTQKILAFNHVKFFKSDLQGKSDSLTYSESDSTLSMFGSPIIWSKVNQISGNQIDMNIHEGKIQKLVINKNSFIISEAGPGKYNQIKGKETIGYFKDNELQRIDVFGNGQIVYFPTEDKDGNTEVIGMNRVECSDVILTVKDNDIVKVALLTKPSGALHPLEKTEESDFTLDGFFWDNINRPINREMIFEWMNAQTVSD